MRYSYLMAALAAPVVIAAPTKRQTANIDTTVLQFALTLEHLENVFYKQALQKFSLADFEAAGYGPDYYNNLHYIASDEESHVEFLSAALTAAKVTPNQACTYKFPYTDVESFITLSSILEGVGTSAYLGGAPLITSKAYLTAAGSILVTEALHTSLQRNAINEIPFATPYGTPLDPTSVYTLAAAFIDVCPPGNAPLPFTPYPSLTLETAAAGTCEQVDCSPQVFYKRDGSADAWSNVAPSKPSETPAPSGPGGKDHGWHNKEYDFNGKCTETGEYDECYDNHGCDYNGMDKDGKYNEQWDNGAHDSWGWSMDGQYDADYDCEGKPGSYTKHGGPPAPKASGAPPPPPKNSSPPSPPKDMGPAPSAPSAPKDNSPAPAAPAAPAATSWTASDVSKSDDKEDSWKSWNVPTEPKNLPALNIGDKVTFSVSKGSCPEGSFLTFVFGLTVVSVPADVSGVDATAAIPATDGGQTYVFLTSAAAQNNVLDGTTVIAGPAILEVKPAPPSIDYNEAK